MTTVAAPITARDEDTPRARTGDRPLRWAARVGWLGLGIQLMLMIALNIVEQDHFGLTLDDASYYQAFYLISRGHLDAFSSIQHFPWWKNNGEWITWPLALLSRPILNQTSFLTLEDLFLVGAGAVGLVWILDVVHRPTWPASFPRWVAVSLYVLLVGLNPWLYTSIAWAWHFEPFDVFVLMLAAYFIEHRQWKRAAVFVALATLTGSTGAALLAGLGITTLLAGRRWRIAGLIVFVTGVATVLFLASLKLQGGNVGHLYGYLVGSNLDAATRANLTGTQILKGVVEHPNRLLSALWASRLNIYANLGPSGIIGFFSPWGLGVPFASLLLSEAELKLPIGIPSFQNVAVYPFVTLGTILLLRRMALARRVPRYLPVALSGVVAANALLWAVVWLPRLPSEWLRVSKPAAEVLHRASEDIPPNAEVLASQGIIGAFSQRQWVFLFGPGRYQLKERIVYFVVTPNQGIEPVRVSDALSAMAYVAENLHATPVAHGGGAWVLRWYAPRGLRSFYIGENKTRIPAWTTPGAAGTDVFLGSAADWMVASSDRPGYLVSGDYWRRGIGHYEATVSLSANVPVNVEVWNQTSNTLLARRRLLPTNGLQDVSFPVDVEHLVPPKVQAGAGPFKILPVAAAPGNSIEIRIWSPGNGEVSVHELGIRRA